MPVVQMPDGSTVDLNDKGMSYAHMKDGRVIEFPAGTSIGTIYSALGGKATPTTPAGAPSPAGPEVPFTDPMSGEPMHVPSGVPQPGSELARSTALVGEAAPRGLELGVSGLAGTAAATMASPVMGALQPALSMGHALLPNYIPSPSEFAQSVGLPAEYAQTFDPGYLYGQGEKAGLTTPQLVQPQGIGEQLLYGGTTGVMAAVPGAGGGGAETVSAVLAGGAASGAGGEVLGPWGTLLGVPVGLAAGRTANALSGELTDVGRQFEAAGIPPRAPALATDSERLQGWLPPTEAQVNATGRDLGNSVERTAAGFGSSRTLQEAGEAIQADGRNWITNSMGPEEDAAWDALNIPNNHPTSIKPFVDALQSMSKQGGQLQDAINLFTSKLPERVLDALRPPGTKTPGLVSVPGSPVTSDTWANVKQLRSAVGQALSDPQIINQIPEQQLRRLYASVTEGMHDAAVETGQEAAFDAANATSTRLRSFAEDTLQPLLDKDPEAAASSLLAGAKKGGTTLAALRNELPTGTGELAAAWLRMNGLTDPSSVTSEIHPQFSGRYASLSNEAKDQLFGSDRAATDAQAGIAGRLKTVETAPPVTESLLHHVIPSALAGIGARIFEHAIGGTGWLSAPGIAESVAAGLPMGFRLGANTLLNRPYMARYLTGAPVNPLVPSGVAGFETSLQPGPGR